jgi:exopolysaccharide biosynthesis WecB/TagA/CpsF family protein
MVDMSQDLVRPGQAKGAADDLLLGFRISSWGAEQIVDAALAGLTVGARPTLVITVNTDHVTKLRHDAAFAAAYTRADIIVCDGWPVALYARLRGHPVRRITGYEIGEVLLRRRSIPQPHRMGFVVDSTATEQALYGWAAQRGMRDRVKAWVPPHNFEHDPIYGAWLARAVADHGTTLLVMGVGAPRSEVFVDRHAEILPACWAFCIGQAVRVEVGLTTRAPPLMQQLRLEWFWRILKEPRRLLGRYIVSTVGFLMAIAADTSGRPVLMGHAAAVSPAQTAFVVSMFGQRGGGMGRIVEYLIEATDGRLAGLNLTRVDTRGQGKAHLSLHHLGIGLLRVWSAAFAGRATLLHLNMAERGSIFRKGIMMLAVKPFKTRTVLHLHAAEIIPMYQRISGLNRFLVRRVFMMADRIIVLGDVWRQWLIGTVGIPANRIDIVHNGVPDFSGQRVERPVDAPVRLLFLANLHPRKGLGDLLPALASLSGLQTAWRLRVAGGGDDARLREQAQQLGIDDRVTFLGWIDHAQAQTELGQADIVALPSYEEGLPLVILEALAAGVPVVTTPVGAIGEVLTHDETALIVQPGDQIGLAGQIARLMTEPGLHQRISVASRKLYEERFSLDKFAQQIERVYRKTLIGSR